MAKETVKGKFQRRLQELRKESGLTQAELADKAGMSIGGLRDLEQGRNAPSWETVVIIAAALGVDCRAFQVEKPEAKQPGRPKKR